MGNERVSGKTNSDDGSNNNDSKNDSKDTKVLQEKIKEKDKTIATLAESVAKSEPPPKRVKLGHKYVSTYSPRALKEMSKKGIDVVGLKVQDPPEF